MTQEFVRIFGTIEPPAKYETLTLGPVGFKLQDGAVRHICVGDVEILRNISFVVRDRNWGTISPKLHETGRVIRDTMIEVTFLAEYRNAGAVILVDLALTVTSNNLTFLAKGRANGDFETNRAGFSVLHPAHLAGSPVHIKHSDGTDTQAVFPDLIDPWRPFMDISKMSHDYDGLSVELALSGDTFETEDQRQWGDASFKTYNRSLDLPWPYVIAHESGIEQSVTLSWRSGGSGHHRKPVETQSGHRRFPQTALVITAQEVTRLAAMPECLDHIKPQRLLCTIDGSIDDMAIQIEQIAALQSKMPNCFYDLELIFPFKESVKHELQGVSDAITRTGLTVASVLICPEVDRHSTPPGSPWPDCPPLEDIHKTAAHLFAGIPRGGGMVSFFPELNRKRPPLTHLDFVTHGLCPIVHAADDLSVMETLENVSHITRSARAIIADRAYRIGPCTIAMRQNPYGAETIENPHAGRVAMAHDDPRHRGDFGAAFAIGLAVALSHAGATVWTPAAVFGPRGIDKDWPISSVIAALATEAEQPIHKATRQDGIATLHVGKTRLRANLLDRPQDGLGIYGWAIDTVTE